jgi:hypothetical protein
MYKTTIAILTTILAVSSAFTSPAIKAAPKSVSSPVEKAFDFSPKQGRQTDVVVTKNALREFANWNDVWDGYGGGYGGGMGTGLRLRR